MSTAVELAERPVTALRGVGRDGDAHLVDQVQHALLVQRQAAPRCKSFVLGVKRDGSAHEAQVRRLA